MWDVESGKTILAIETGLTSVWAVIYVFLPGTTITKIATGGSNQGGQEFIKIWDTTTGKLIASLKGHTDRVFCLAWTQNRLISGSADHSIRIWNTATWQQVAVLTGHTNSVKALAIYPNGHILASASWDDTVRLWDLENNRSIGLPLHHHVNAIAVNCISFSADGKLLVTGCGDNNAYAWDISTIIRETALDERLFNPNVSPFLVSELNTECAILAGQL